MVELLLTLACFLGADVAKSQSDHVMKSLNGEWAAISFEAGGQSTSTLGAGWKVIIRGNRISIKFGRCDLAGDLVLGLDGKHRTLAVKRSTGTVVVDGKAQGEFAQGQMDVAGLYKLERGRLVVCYRFGAIPPSSFQTNQPDTMLQVFERVK
jgi:uncharacterized protein (TIGR03067 family)